MDYLAENADMLQELGELYEVVNMDLNNTNAYCVSLI